MTLRINTTGKLLGGAIAAWAGSKILKSLMEFEHGAAEQTPSRTVDPDLQAALDRTIPQSVQDDLTAYAMAGDGRSFSALLDAHGAPANPKLRSRLWAHFGGD